MKVMNDKIDLLKDDIIKTYDDLHKIPEIGWGEYKTSAYIKEFMAAHGYSDYVRVGETGLVYTLDSGVPGPTVALRVDIDALEHVIGEKKVCMHTCGHDAHTTMGLFTAALAKDFITRGKLKFVFQPCEEDASTSGALAVLDAGVMDDVDKAIGIHLRPIAEAKSNQVIPSLRHGGLRAIRVLIRGEASHGGRPHLGCNSIDAAMFIINAINAIKMDPEALCSAKVTTIEGGADISCIPEACRVSFDLRARTNDALDLLYKKALNIIETGAKLNGCTSEIYEEGIYVAAEADSRMVELASESIVEVLGPDGLLPPRNSVGAEDFNYFTKMRPIRGTYLGLGCNLTPGLHNPNMSFEKDQLLTGIKILTVLAQKALAED